MREGVRRSLAPPSRSSRRKLQMQTSLETRKSAEGAELSAHKRKARLETGDGPREDWGDRDRRKEFCGDGKVSDRVSTVQIRLTNSPVENCELADQDWRKPCRTKSPRPPPNPPLSPKYFTGRCQLQTPRSTPTLAHSPIKQTRRFERRR
jgi:hypothetical protein